MQDVDAYNAAFIVLLQKLQLQISSNKEPDNNFKYFQLMYEDTKTYEDGKLIPQPFLVHFDIHSWKYIPNFYIILF